MDGALTLIFVLVFAWQVDGAPFDHVTPRNTDDSIRFMVIADWGGSPKYPYTTSVQTAVANQMAATASKEKPSFILSLGDNIYMAGVKSYNDPRFQTTFQQVYNHGSLNMPWYLIAGNHDHYGSVTSQIVYSRFSRNWNFPDYYYKKSWTLPGGKILDILMIDTIILCGNILVNSKGHTYFGFVDSYRAEKEWSWIEKHLKESTADYVLVCGHYPVYSVGSNGPSRCLYERLEPLLYKYHVTAYLSGHDHNLQHIQTEKDGQHMDYFITGSGSYVSQKQSNIDHIPRNSLKFFFAENHRVGGFSLFDVTDTNMKMKFIDSNGETRHEYIMRPRKLVN